ncbi:MAG: ATP synthase F0 subunit C [Dehalococcoidales bacterium]|nr:ATP synthase F0 subunit C [Dehalococcoidales bacterium]
MTPEVMKMLAVGLAVGLGMLGPALALGLIGFAALQGISRNPEASGPILTNMILIGALAEAVAIYVLIIGIILAIVVQ